jgi:iron complex outermembrane receptor protein
MPLSRILFAVAACELAVVDLAHSQNVLEEIVVTATRVETNLQTTPLSVHSISGENLELAGIDAGRDLGIMVPNTVINPGNGSERQPKMIIRGLPGVATYLDGFQTNTNGFLQRGFVDLDRVEIMRGPQGTHFGRNSNGGAIQLVTRKPAESFGARFGLQLGDFGRRELSVGIDAPVSSRLLTRWTAASFANDGFLESQSGPFKLGDEDSTLFRGDILWNPTDKLSLRFTVNDEDRLTSDPRVVRISNPLNRFYVAYNVLAGNPEFLSQARAIDPNFPDPPFALAGDRYTPETHESGFPGGSLGRWQTRSDTPGPTAVSDTLLTTMTIDWEINDHWSLRSLTSHTRFEDRNITDFDASEFTFTTLASNSDGQATTQEFHLRGDHLGGRLQTLFGVWHWQLDRWDRVYQWLFWDFVIPNIGPNPPELNASAIDYVRAWGATVGNNAVAGIAPPVRASFDDVGHERSREQAIFAEVTVRITDALDLTLGVRRTGDDEGSSGLYVPADALRPAEPGRYPSGDHHAIAAEIRGGTLPDLGSVSTPRVSLGYALSDSVYFYASYAEGFTQGEIVTSSLVPDPIVLDPEVVKTKEIGLRSDWLDSRLRLNATYFDSEWDGLRVKRRFADPDSPGGLSPFPIPTSDGVAASSGLEIELSWLPFDYWQFDLAVGLLDTEYLDIGEPPANGSGLQPGIPFAYAPELSYALSIRYQRPSRNGSRWIAALDYGWMDEYQRDSASEFQTKDANGRSKPEPAYGLLNARVAFEPQGSKWQVTLFGTNLTDEWYVNGGLNTGLFWGYDFATIGRPRELGVGLQYRLN